MGEFLQHLKERKLVQWALAYAAGGFALLQGIDIVAQLAPDDYDRSFDAPASP